MTEGWICPVCGAGVAPSQVAHCDGAAQTQRASAPSQQEAQTVSAPSQNGAASDAAASAHVVASSSKAKPKHRKPVTYTAEFEQFWAVWILKLDKAKAQRAFDAAIASGAELAQIIAGAEHYAEYVRRNRIEPRHTKYAQGWLSDERWNDDYGLPAAVGGSDPAYTVGTHEYNERLRKEGIL